MVVQERNARDKWFGKNGLSLAFFIGGMHTIIYCKKLHREARKAGWQAKKGSCVRYMLV